jgi:hypothetical protein
MQSGQWCFRWWGEYSGQKTRPNGVFSKRMPSRWTKSFRPEVFLVFVVFSRLLKSWGLPTLILLQAPEHVEGLLGRESVMNDCIEASPRQAAGNALAYAVQCAHHGNRMGVLPDISAQVDADGAFLAAWGQIYG